MFPIPPALNQWFQTILSPLASQYLFPTIPAGASNPQTQAYGPIGGAYGNFPSTAVINGSAPAPTVGSPLTDTTDYATRQKQKGASSPAFPPSMTTSPLTISPTVSTTPTPAPPPTAPSPTGRNAFGISRTPPLTPSTGTNAAGVPARGMITSAEVKEGGFTDQQMRDAGYIMDDSGNWQLASLAMEANTPGTDAALQENGYTQNADGTWNPPSTGNEYWRTSGSNYGKVGREGKVHGQTFGSEQAYNSWLNRKKKLERKEEDSGGLGRATEVVTPSYGTG